MTDVEKLVNGHADLEIQRQENANLLRHDAELKAKKRRQNRAIRTQEGIAQISMLALSCTAIYVMVRCEVLSALIGGIAIGVFAVAAYFVAAGILKEWGVIHG